MCVETTTVAMSQFTPAEPESPSTRRTSLKVTSTDAEIADGLAHPRVAQRADLALTLGCVPRDEISIDVARMTAQLGHAVGHGISQKLDQAGHTNVSEIRHALPLTVEIGNVTNLGEVTNQQVLLLRDGEALGKHLGPPVHVVVRIEVRRRGAHQILEPRQLTAQSRADLVRGAGIKFGVQANPQARSLAGHPRGFNARWTIDEEARAREDTVSVGFQNAAVDAAARTKIVPVDNQVLHVLLEAAESRVEPATVTAE